MFLQLVTPPVSVGAAPIGADVVRANAYSLFLYHPAQIFALHETIWRWHYSNVTNGIPNVPFVSWPSAMTDSILNNDSFVTAPAADDQLGPPDLRLSH
jgi:hypothetical protein